MRSQICARYLTGPCRIVTAADPQRDRDAADYSGAVRGLAGSAGRCLRAPHPGRARPGWPCRASWPGATPACTTAPCTCCRGPGARRGQLRPARDPGHQQRPGAGRPASGQPDPDRPAAAPHHRAAARGGRVPRAHATTSSSCSTRGPRSRSPTSDDEIYWGAYVGTPDEILISGRVADVGRAHHRRAGRRAAAARLDHGHLPAPPARLCAGQPVTAPRRTVLILGGTSRGAGAGRPPAPGGRDCGWSRSLAGRVRNPALPAGEVRIGGFGGAGRAGRLADRRAGRRGHRRHPSVRRGHLGATPPPPARRPRRRCCGLGPAGLDRGETATPGTTRLARATPLSCCPALGERVFLTTGRQGLPAFAPPASRPGS